MGFLIIVAVPLYRPTDLSLGRCAGGRPFRLRHLASFDLRDGSVSPGGPFRALRLLPVEAAPDGLWLGLD